MLDSDDDHYDPSKEISISCLPEVSALLVILNSKRNVCLKV